MSYRLILEINPRPHGQHPPGYSAIFTMPRSPAPGKKSLQSRRYGVAPPSRGGKRSGAGAKRKPIDQLKVTKVRALVAHLGAAEIVAVYGGGKVYMKVIARVCNRCPRIILRTEGALAHVCSACKLFAAQQRAGRSLDAERRARVHARRQSIKSRRNGSDLTRTREREIRAAAFACALCHVRFAPVSGLPTSRTLDHVVPLGVGGLHVESNVRVTCRSCNLRRPKDGSDL